MKKSALGLVGLCLVAAIVAFAKREGRFSAAAGGGSNCVSLLPGSVSLNCVPFSGHLYAVAEIDLRRQKIIFTTSNNGKKETFPEVFSGLAREGIQPLLMTNGGIYMAQTIVRSVYLFRLKGNCTTRTSERMLRLRTGIFHGTVRYSKFQMRAWPQSCR
ncbi:MAG TPA: hypothetical protein VK812_17465 [Candidatus Binatus sp.]|jgi:hypothetical protein|nr:hypothetical protein [Candidatus Binatus sp.]